MSDVFYMSGNSFFLISAGQTAELLPQRIVRYRETLKDIQTRNEWKTAGSGARFMGTYRGSVDYDTQGVDAQVRGIAKYKEGIVYSAYAGQVSGLYQKSLDARVTPEGHIMATNAVDISKISIHGDLCAAGLRSGRESHIALFTLPSGKYEELTEGEVIEDYPYFSEDGERIYFSSAGLALSQDGRVEGVGPFGVYRYSMKDKTVEDLYSSGDFHYIAPKEDKEGNIYFIKRPYRQKASGGNLFLDILFFPVRIIRAIGGLLNFFSIFFGGEALRSNPGQPGAARSKQRDNKEIFIDGNAVNAQEMLKKNQRAGERFPGIIPHSWELVKVDRHNTQSCLKKGVMDYALCANGDILYSNGHAVIRLFPDGTEELVERCYLASNLMEI